MCLLFLFFFFHATPTPELYTLSYTTLFRSVLCHERADEAVGGAPRRRRRRLPRADQPRRRHLDQPRARLLHPRRSEEHTSELQSPCNLVCRLLLEKKKLN